MKLCRFCNEFACGQSGTKAISEHCGYQNVKISCYVFSDNYEKSIAKINEITTNSVLYELSHYRIETDKEIWKLVNPTPNNIRGIKPVKAYIDKDLSFGIVTECILPRCEFAVEVHYF